MFILQLFRKCTYSNQVRWLLNHISLLLSDKDVEINHQFIYSNIWIIKYHIIVCTKRTIMFLTKILYITQIKVFYFFCLAAPGLHYKNLSCVFKRNCLANAVTSNCSSVRPYTNLAQSGANYKPTMDQIILIEHTGMSYSALFDIMATFCFLYCLN